MDRLQHLAKLKEQFKQLRVTTVKPKNTNKQLPKGCADFRYSRTFQIQARRAVLAKGGVA
ncbi:hypothetical protein C9I92_00025 [Photobacterium ganghwense]|uniref:Uncharacterized protein n=1 Tax=Photobacterium ganghwense TaxID=320778 RepID=A0A0J1H585_9GAMM|nr:MULTISPECIES: hypothetical protein [Photobacterium]KLV06898.1 hypothetical protein ABT57_18390 [Photobacterium ganghwense]PSU10566.1 hypothetical protein C9I92_00025 [Photobacterium ganghwense]